MSSLVVTLVDLAGDRDAPLLVVGPSLGTAVQPLWQPVADLLADSWHVVGWDLPGHGTNRSVPRSCTLADLADAVASAVDEQSFTYAGDSVGGAVGLHLLLRHADSVSGAVLCCTGAVIGTAQGWTERAATVRADGTQSQVAGSRERWFGPGFTDREPSLTTALLDSLSAADPEGYAVVCEALAGHDVRGQLGSIGAPVRAIGGDHDGPTPPEQLREIADGVQHGTLTILDGVGHLAPVEAPQQVAEVIRSLRA